MNTTATINNATLGAAGARSKTIREILQERDAARDAIYAKARQLQERAEALKDLGYDRPLTDKEIVELGELYAAIGSLAAAENELMIITVRALNASDEVTRLVNVVDAVNADLKAKLKVIERAAKQVTKVGDLFKKLEGVAEGLTKLAATFV